MGRTSAPPLAEDVIRKARLAKFMSRADVLRELAKRGVSMDESNLSRIENNKVRWPALRVIPALAEVLDLKPGEMFEAQKEAA